MFQVIMDRKKGLQNIPAMMENMFTVNITDRIMGSSFQSKEHME